MNNGRKGFKKREKKELWRDQHLRINSTKGFEGAEKDYH